MSTTNKQLLRRFFEELFNRGDLRVADEIVSATYINHNPVPGETPGREGLKAYVSNLRIAFPDIRFTIEDLLADEDKVITRWSARGTHKGEFAGIPATGRSGYITAINIHRIQDGQIQEGWLNWDALGLMQQLGAIPTAESAAK
jgi:steroid delta-isomerase-like uncharacterized protein